MKIKNKFLTGALLTFASLGLVGSITSTFAWYSYNTKDTFSYHGIASGNSQNLQVRLQGEEDDDWRTNITSDELETWSTTNNYAGSNLGPVSFIENRLETDVLEDDDFYGRPETYTNRFVDDSGNHMGVKDNNGKYTFFHAIFEVKSSNPAQSTETAEKLYAQNVYLSDIRCKASTKTRDMSDAVRVYFGSSTYTHLIAPNETVEDKVTTNLWGKMSSDGSGINDRGVLNDDNTTYRPAYDSDEGNGAVDIIYGVENAKEVAYTAKSSVAKFDGGKRVVNTGYSLGQTTLDSEHPLQIHLYVYLQGWDESCKDSNIGAEFDLGFTIQTEQITDFSGADKVQLAKDEAVAAIEGYKTELASSAKSTEYTEAVTAGKANINAATTEAGVATALSEAKAAIDAVELALAKEDAIAALNAYKSTCASETSREGEYNTAVFSGETAINEATTLDEVATALENAKAAVDAVELNVAKDAAKAELAGYSPEKSTVTGYEAAVEAGNTAINEATTLDEVATALADAKAAIDLLVVE